MPTFEVKYDYMLHGVVDVEAESEEAAEEWVQSWSTDMYRLFAERESRWTEVE